MVASSHTQETVVHNYIELAKQFSEMLGFFVSFTKLCVSKYDLGAKYPNLAPKVWVVSHSSVRK